MCRGAGRTRACGGAATGQGNCPHPAVSFSVRYEGVGRVGADPEQKALEQYSRSSGERLVLATLVSVACRPGFADVLVEPTPDGAGRDEHRPFDAIRVTCQVLGEQRAAPGSSDQYHLLGTDRASHRIEVVDSVLDGV